MNSNVYDFSTRQPVADLRETVSSDKDTEMVDLNEIVTGGKEGFVIYNVTGRSRVPEIKTGDKVFVDMSRKPKETDVTVMRYGGATHIHQGEKTGLVVTGYMSLYK